ncbi:helix-turn-helix transcriptional regulator [Nocardioides dongxiaopingii]|uniref:helix-turn-helix transcriptional regulator n=1 Tax=Nocardioides dongxiaopingii TaxID=2576036 RepID=UPI0010C76E48|nr:WYL domain-containing protein [Nocardioides dongxiaopingii]
MPTTSSRLLTLLSLLQTRRDWSGDLLADRLDVSTRTVRRDVDRLRELGYRIATTKGPDGGYRLAAGADLPPLLLDDDQAVAVGVALRIAATGGAGLGDDVAEGALRALTTVRQVMPARLRRRLDTLPVTVVEPPGGPRSDVDSAVLLALGAAVHAREVLRLDYASDATGGGAAPRRVEPHHLVTWRGRWYLVAWDLDRQDWRTLRADRVAPRVPTGPRFAERELPGGDVATFVTGRFRGAEGSTGWPCEGEVVLALPVAAVEPYVGDGVVEAVGDARTRLVEGAWSWPALAAALCRFDAELEVVGPPELAAAFDLLAGRCARAGGAGRG